MGENRPVCSQNISASEITTENSENTTFYSKTMKLLYVVSGLGLLAACAIAKPIETEFDEDCVEVMDQPLEIDYASVQQPEILPAYDQADLTMEFGVDYEEADCAEELEDYATTEAATETMEPDYECEEEPFELAPLPGREEEEFFEAAYDQANNQINKDYSDMLGAEDNRVVDKEFMNLISDECEEIEANPLNGLDYNDNGDYAGDFGFKNYKVGLGYVEESERIIVDNISDGTDAFEVEECAE